MIRKAETSMKSRERKVAPHHYQRAIKQRSNAVQSKPPPPITKKGQATRERLKQALNDLLQDTAFKDIRIEDIAARAGGRGSLFYHYFQSKIDITNELLSELLDTYLKDVSIYSRSSPLESIHFANQRMAELYVANPGAMRCLLDVHDEDAPFALIWRKRTREWNERIAQSIQHQFPQAFANLRDYLAIAYALAGAADNLLYEYYVLKNPDLHAAHPEDEDVAKFLTTLWHRTLYLKNPPMDFMGKGLDGLAKLRAADESL
jgi:AcrR family transcriptional regulator